MTSGAGSPGAVERESPQGRAPWAVDVVAAEPAPGPRHLVLLCLVGVMDAREEPVGARAPRHVVDAGGIWEGARWERLRFRGRDALHALPGLDGPQPSRLRDAARLALSSGAEEIDVLIAAVPGATPASLADPVVLGVLGEALDGLLGATLVLPDAIGRPALRPDSRQSLEAAWAHIGAIVSAWAEGLTERYQVALLDAPDDGLSGAAPPRLPSADVALCCWHGDPATLRRQGWRSAAAAAGGALASLDVEVMRSIRGRRVALGPGRHGTVSRRALVGVKPPLGPLAPQLVRLCLEPEGLHARIDGESTLRQPWGTWSLGSLRTAKALHRRIVQAANLVVFRPADSAHAFALIAALDEAISPFIHLGLLVGAGGKGIPELGAQISTDPAAPGLIAEVIGQLQPWCADLRVRVRLHGGGPAEVEWNP